MGKNEALRARHERLSRDLGMPAASGAAPSGRGAGGGGDSGGCCAGWKSWHTVLLILLLLLVCGGGAAWYVGMRRGGDAHGRLAAAAAANREAVALVAAETADGAWIPFATAWALRTNVFVSNAHVVEQARMLSGRGHEVFMLVNGRPDVKLRVIGTQSHRLYGRPGHEEVDFAYDIGTFAVEGSAPAVFRVADAKVLRGLQAGEAVAYLGFPMEQLVKGGVRADSPVAVMQAGIVTAVSDFTQGEGGEAGNLLIRHNLGATGGASGSPLFNRDGVVVGVLNAVNMTRQFAGLDAQGLPVLARAPSAAMINFAQRVDLMDGLGAETPLVAGVRDDGQGREAGRRPAVVTTQGGER